MSVNAAAAAPHRAAPWTCPFCPLLSDGFRVEGAGRVGPLRLAGGAGPRLQAAVARFEGLPPEAVPWIDGTACTLEEAVAEAARRLAAARQPLLGGLGTDVAGARALYRLAARCGAIADARGGPGLTQALRALQDRGGFTTTLAEIRARGELIVCFGRSPGAASPELWPRCGLDDAEGPARRVVLVGGEADPWLADWTRGPVERVATQGDLLTTVSLLVALLEGRPVPAAEPALRALAETMRAARYTVLTWDASGLPVHSGLIVEALQRVVAALNRSTRAGAFALAGEPSGHTVNAVWAWLSGLPLRSRAGPYGLEHEPLLYDATLLLAQGAVDLLFWVSSFDPEAAPPVTSLPRIVLGAPGMEIGAGSGVFIPVSTPGIGTPGHLFRSDTVVLLPLEPARPDALPTVAEVAGRIAEALAAAPAATRAGAGASAGEGA